MLYFTPTDWKELKHGMFYKCLIADVHCIGRISINPNGEVYLCQNKKNGYDAQEDFGFHHGWCINPFDDNEKYNTLDEALKAYSVSDFVVTDRITPAIGIEDFNDGDEFIAEFINFDDEVLYSHGIINIENYSIYLCQDKISGDSCRDKKGFNFSYVIKTATMNMFIHPQVFRDVKWVAIVNKVSRKGRINNFYKTQ